MNDVAPVKAIFEPSRPLTLVPFRHRTAVTSGTGGVLRRREILPLEFDSSWCIREGAIQYQFLEVPEISQNVAWTGVKDKMTVCYLLVGGSLSRNYQTTS